MTRSKQTLKIKQGLPGFLNGCSVPALADTGSTMNVVSKSYAKSLKLKIKRSFGELQLGNSRIARSIGMYYMVSTCDGVGLV